LRIEKCAGGPLTYRHKEVGVVKFQLDDNLMSDLWVALVWEGAAV
jgi:hypothetical protein